MAGVAKISGDIFKYNIDITVVLNGGKNPKKDIIKVSQNNIQYMYIDYEYDRMNMPFIFISLALDKNLADRMVEGANNTLITLRVSKYIANTDMKLPIDYINGQFVYILSENYNTNKAMDYQADPNRPDVYKIIDMGLLRLSHINKNKKNFSGVISGTTLTSMIYYCIKDMDNIVMEPLKYNTNIKQIILPPLDSVAKAISYLNKTVHALYDTSYRFFMDFNNTYFISSSGKAIPRKGDKINSIMINIHKQKEEASLVQGMTTDKKRGLYLIDVGENDVEPFDNRLAEKSFNALSITSAGGVTGNSALKLNNSKYLSSKNQLMRVPNDNTTLLANKRHDMETNVIVLNISKSDIDSSVFTINREYNIKATGVYPDKDGKYLLASKQEVYMREMDHINQSVFMIFKKI